LRLLGKAALQQGAIKDGDDVLGGGAEMRF
jgi:hypothetical protein